MCQCRVIGFSDVIVCKFHIIFICGGVMRWIASEIYGLNLIGVNYQIQTKNNVKMT